MKAISAKRQAQNSKRLFCALSFALGAVRCPLMAEPLTEYQARFGAVTGDVGLLTQGAAEWIVPHEGLPIEPGDHIRTGDDGRAEMALSDNAFWILEPQSEIVAEHMDINSVRFDLSSGTLMGKVDSARAVGFPQHWDFQTPAAVVAVRGTEFAIEARGRQGTSLGVFEGTVDMQPAETASGLQPPVQVTAGQQADAKRGRLIQTSQRFSPRMKALAARRPFLQSRQRQIQNIWSPFTPTVRSELRKKFVVPPPKRRLVPPHRRARAPQPTPQ